MLVSGSVTNINKIIFDGEEIETKHPDPSWLLDHFEWEAYESFYILGNFMTRYQKKHTVLFGKQNSILENNIYHI